jgi:hypothetical protein
MHWLLVGIGATVQQFMVAYGFDPGVLSHPLTTLIESVGKHWVSEIEKTRLI